MDEILLIGNGSHAKAVIDCCSLLERDHINIAFEEINDYTHSDFEYIIAIGSIDKRKRISNYTFEHKAKPATLIHPTAHVSSTAKIGNGCFIGPYAFIGPHSCIGDHCIINTRSTIEHGVCIGNICNISPHCCICGESIIGNHSFLGASTTVIESIQLPDLFFSAAGSIIVTSFKDQSVRVKGVPAKQW